MLVLKMNICSCAYDDEEGSWKNKKFGIELKSAKYYLAVYFLMHVS